MTNTRVSTLAALTLLALAAAGCGASEQDVQAGTDFAADRSIDARELNPDVAEVPADETIVPAPAPVESESGVVLVVAPTGNEARYRVREVLVGFELPNDAVGRTSAVSGSLTLATNGSVGPGSAIVVDITGLQSDQDRRDGYLQRRVLGGEEYPTVRLVPREIRGVTSPLPTSGTANVTIVGDLTVRDVTRPSTWQGQATFAGGRITGTATTAFTFDDIQLTKPRVPAVASVNDTIRLEYDFNLLASPAR